MQVLGILQNGNEVWKRSDIFQSLWVLVVSFFTNVHRTQCLRPRPKHSGQSVGYNYKYHYFCFNSHICRTICINSLYVGTVLVSSTIMVSHSLILIRDKPDRTPRIWASSLFLKSNLFSLSYLYFLIFFRSTSLKPSAFNSPRLGLNKWLSLHGLMGLTKSVARHSNSKVITSFFYLLFFSMFAF